MEARDQGVEIVIICDVFGDKTVFKDHEWEN